MSTTVNVLCELSRRDPARYLPLAPQLFGLLTTSSNNWMLIKIVKIVSAFIHGLVHCYSSASLVFSSDLSAPGSLGLSKSCKHRSPILSTPRLRYPFFTNACGLASSVIYSKVLLVTLWPRRVPTSSQSSWMILIKIVST